MELLGEIPKGIAFSGSSPASPSTGKENSDTLTSFCYWPLNMVLHNKYLSPKPGAEALGSFPLPMQHLHPDWRAKASELVDDNLLDGVVVQG
ncbi:hypothetical protein DFP72DRAFT_1083735 [Ephemerocybe angulata]|uniref:Uncharacterized protein n=1 Tax=Ephemerocybe angulata TaxID=980116 RepID=A0A8H6H6S6_9AGAR|nr:hypothetical protein DFP72DRAFT_1083735 [Tulosesus angulatus]